MTDAAMIILGSSPATSYFRCYIDEAAPRFSGITDLSCYLADGATEDELRPDLFP